MALAIGTASAQSSVETIARLEAQMQAMQNEIAALKREQSAMRAEAPKRTLRPTAQKTAEPAGPPAIQVEDDSVRVTDYASGNSFDVDYGGAPEFAILDADDEVIFSFKPRGRVFVDIDYADGDEIGRGETLGGILLDPASDPYPSPETEFDALRLGVEGVIMRSLEYKLEVDYDDSELDLADAYLAYTGPLLPVDVTIGNFKHPTSLYEQTSSRFITFAERPMFTDAFDFSRRLGVSVGNASDHFSFVAGVFGDSPNGDDFDDGLLVGGRLTYAPVNNFPSDPDDIRDLRAVHLGVSGFYRETGDGDRLYDFYDGDIVGGNPNFFGTFDFAGDSDVFVGAEFAYVRGPFSLQAEYGVDFVEADNDRGTLGPLAATIDDPTFHGGYVEASYFLGANAARNYEVTDFGRPILADGVSVTEGGMGAVELAARFDYLDLNDGGLNGGEVETYGIGVNWWTTRYSRFLVDYFRTEVDDATDLALSDGLPFNNSVDTFIGRAQIDF